MNIKNSILCCLIAFLALPVLGAFAETPEAFSVQLVTTFDHPDSGNSTLPSKISDLGDIVGTYSDFFAIRRGFIRFRNGNFSPSIVDPNDTGGDTEARGINNSRLVCGYYFGADGIHGYFLRRSRFHDFDVPDGSGTLILGVNNAGDFCGSYVPDGGVQSAFFSLGGVITVFTVPRANASLAYQINSSNQVCGTYFDDSFVNHGYYRDSDGTIYAPIDPVGSTETGIFGNNDSNWMVGSYSDSGGLSHGLLFIPPNRYITYDYPDSIFTSLNGINAQ